MGKYSSDSEGEYKKYKSRRKDNRSPSTSSRGSYVSRKSHHSKLSQQSHSHTRSIERHRTSNKVKHKEEKRYRRSKSSSKSRRTRSPTRKKYKSHSSSRSRSRSRSSSVGHRGKKEKSYRTDLRCRSRSSSRSRSKYLSYRLKRRKHSRSYSRSRSHSRLNDKSRHRRSRKSKSFSSASEDKSSDSVEIDVMDGKQLEEIKQKLRKKALTDFMSSGNVNKLIENNSPNAAIPIDNKMSENPVLVLSESLQNNRESIDEINNLSFAPRHFKSCRNSNIKTTNIEKESRDLSDYNALNRPTITNNNIPITDENNLSESIIITAETKSLPENSHTCNGTALPVKIQNNTIFHDNLLLENKEEKLKKWVQRLYQIRQRHLFGFPGASM